MQDITMLPLLLLACLYFVPGIVASCRNSPHSLPIWILTICLGWTVLFWILALVWATMPVPSKMHGVATSIRPVTDNTKG